MVGSMDVGVAEGRARDRQDGGPVAAVRGEHALCALVEVSKRFGGVAAVEHVSFDVRPGEVHALVGENGAGKSTLMKMLHGIHAPDEGRVEIDGTPVQLRSPHDAERAGIAMIPQEIELFPDLPVAENLYVGRRRPRGPGGLYDAAAMRAEARRVFASLGVEIDVRAPVRYLSVASKQLVAIGRALLGDVRVAIMDEPTAALTEREAERLFAVIRGLQERGVGIVYISHRLAEITSLADRITVMRDGRHVATRPAAELSPQEMVRLMVGRPLSQLFSREHAVSDAVALELRGLTRAGEFHDVSLHVRHGEVLGLAGLIGAGRTEVAQTIFGLRKPDAGELLVDGAPVTIRTPEQALRAGIGYVPEERRAQALFLPMAIKRNISYSSLERLTRNGIVQTRREAGMAGELMQRLGVRGAGANDPVIRLSGGNQQKVVLAKSLATEPSILILDEPTRGVDVGAKAEIYRLIDALAREGKAILLISSELDEVLAMSDRLIVMCEGRVAAELDHAEATRERVTAAASGVAEPAADDAPPPPLEAIEGGAA